MSAPDKPFLPYARQAVTEDDIAAVTAVLRSDFLTQGPAVDAFERALRETLGAQHAVACATGTAALHLAAMALGLGPGDAAIVPAITFMATANAVRYTGADVVFADVDAETGLMTAETLEDAILRAGGKARAVLPVHLNGQSADIAAIAAVAACEGLAVIEDACHAIGGTQIINKGSDGTESPIGACGASAAATFSFHPAKTIAAGEGGAVTTNDAVLAERMRQLRSHGVARDGFENAAMGYGADGEANPWYHELQTLGFNYRLSDLQCALGASQLARLKDAVERRSALTAAYDAALKPLANGCPSRPRQAGLASLCGPDRLRRHQPNPRAGDECAARARHRHPGPFHPGQSPALLRRARRAGARRRRALLCAGFVLADDPCYGRG
jgi:dTDP-4-amino-4,6-dideoxygalactose transaminase